MIKDIKDIKVVKDFKDFKDSNKIKQETMKAINKYIKVFAAAAFLIGTASCTGDLDQYPHTETTSEDVYTTLENYEAVLGKIYVSMTTVGQGKGGNNPDLASNSSYDYMRSFFNLQESGTDELAPTWLSGDKMTDITYLSWDADDPWVSDMYYRLYYDISLTNEFLRHCGDEELSKFTSDEQTKLKRYRAEARFMRALFYYHALDMFRYIPFVDENDPVGSWTPPRNTPQQTFDFIESELQTIVSDLAPASECPYGEASQGAAYTLLAKLYLNAEIYIGTSKYDECIAACQQVIAQGYTLESDYAKLFNGDNHKRTNEIIFALPVDAEHTMTWGTTTYIIHGEVGTTSSQTAADYGIETPWGMFRSRGELPQKFLDEDNVRLMENVKDKRCMFFTTDQTQYLDEALDDQAEGYFVSKWTNLTDDGEFASDPSNGVSTDFPMFRLADVYLMYAEAVLRGDAGRLRSQALGYVNALKERAYGNTDGNISDSQLTLSYILDERARELYWECSRRTDLIRYGYFTTSSYLWQWKGGTKDGTSVDSKYNIYPIPATELTANPNLYNENY